MKHYEKTINMACQGPTVYEFTRAFREGARAFWRRHPWSFPPYPDGSQRAEDWQTGHGLASEGAITKREVNEATRRAKSA